MKADNWQVRSVLLALVLMMAGMVGCPPTREVLPPVTDDVPSEVVIERVNRNVRAMDFLLRAGGVSASGKVARASGKTDSFDANGTLFFRRPRNLYMELQQALAGKIEMGSNAQEFWYWEKFEHEKYYTGRHAGMPDPWETDIPLRPDQLVEMLGLSELPTRTGGAGGPTFVVGDDYYFLNFFNRDAGGKTFQSKSVAISRRPPFLVSTITYYNPGSQPWLRAELKEYRPIEGTSVLTPRRIEIRSLEDQSRMTLEFGNMKPSDNTRVEQERIIRSPLDRREDVGEIIRLDRPR